MADLKMDVARVDATAERIKKLNDEMNNGFETARRALKTLDSYWDSPAATGAISKFDSVRSSYSEPRYRIVDNYVGFLKQQVGIGYANTEAANVEMAAQYKDLAAKFK